MQTHRHSFKIPHSTEYWRRERKKKGDCAPPSSKVILFLFLSFRLSLCLSFSISLFLSFSLHLTLARSPALSLTLPGILSVTLSLPPVTSNSRWLARLHSLPPFSVLSLLSLSLAPLPLLLLSPTHLIFLFPPSRALETVLTERSMGWLPLVGSFKSQVSFAGYILFYRAVLQKRPIFLGSLRIVATPCHDMIYRVHMEYLSSYLCLSSL